MLSAGGNKLRRSIDVGVFDLTPAPIALESAIIRSVFVTLHARVDRQPLGADIQHHEDNSLAITTSGGLIFEDDPVAGHELALLGGPLVSLTRH